MESMNSIRKTNITEEELQEVEIEQLSEPVVVIDETTSDTQLQKIVEEIRHADVIGMDTETKPAFKRGVHHKVSLLQVAIPGKVYLFRLPRILDSEEKRDYLSFLWSEAPVKVGVGIGDDTKALLSDYKMETHNFCELRHLSSAAGIEVLALSKIYAVLFNRRLSKAQRLTNWEAPVLSAPQCTYAALDAVAGLKIYLALREYMKEEFLASTVVKPKRRVIKRRRRKV